MKTNISMFILLFLSSCNFYSKEQYISNYKCFVNEIKSNHKSFTEDDWLKFDKKNKKFFQRDYKRFAGDLKPNEYLKVQRYNFVYNYYRGEIDISSLLKGEYNELFKNIVKETSEIAKEIGSMLYDASKEDKLSIINKLLQ